MANIYPSHVVINQQNIAELTSTFERSYKQITHEILTATDFGVKNRRAILSQIETILEGLGVDVQSFLDRELPGYYKIGADEGIRQLRNVKADISVSTGFNRIHENAINALVDDASRSFGESLTGVGRSANLLLGRTARDLMTEQIATGIIGGAAMRRVRNNIKGVLADQGLSALVDKGGRKWSLDTYAEMLFRTKVVESRNRGLMNRLAENGFDLVQVSNHNSSHAACAQWEGVILSISGQTQGFSTVAEAEVSGLFHPNCEHAINAISPAIAKMTQAYYPDERARQIDEEQMQKLTDMGLVDPS